MTDTLERERLMRLLGTRGAMTDHTLFVGRATECRKLDGVVGPPHNCAWIFGPPRNGKSSLARHAAARARSNGVRVSLVDCSSLPAGSFDELIANVVENAGATRPSIESARTAFTSLVSRSRIPTLVVFDEFDRHAMQLGLDEQAYLRGTKETHENLAYVFVSRADPKHIVEDVSVARSRLLGICSVVNVPILEPADVAKLCRVVADAFGLDCSPAWAASITATVGGHPMTVMEILYNVAARLFDSAGGESEVDAVLSLERESISATLRRHWRALPATCRMFILDAGLDDCELRISAEREGYWSRKRQGPLRPSFLLDVARVEGLASVEDAPGDGLLTLVLNLHQLMGVTNLICNRAGHPDVFSPPHNDFLHYYELNRPMRSESELHPAIDHLSKLVYEGARQRRPGQEASDSEWRISNERARRRFVSSDGIRVLQLLRNYYDHSPHKDTAALPREKSVGEWFLKACGCRTPSSPSQFEQVIRALLTNLVDAVAKLVEDLSAAELTPVER